MPPLSEVQGLQGFSAVPYGALHIPFLQLGLHRAMWSAVPTCSHADAGTSSPNLLTTVPANAAMANVTAFVDVTNIAQYTSSHVAIMLLPQHTACHMSDLPQNADCTAVCPVRVPCADQPCWSHMCPSPNKCQHHLRDLPRCLLKHRGSAEGQHSTLYPS